MPSLLALTSCSHGSFLIGVSYDKPNFFVLHKLQAVRAPLSRVARNLSVRRSSDRRWMELFVAFLFLANTVNSVFDLVYIYDSLVNHFDCIPGDAKYLTNATWVFATGEIHFLSTALQSNQRRVYVVSKNIFCVVTIVVCAAGSLLCSRGTSIAVGIVLEYTEFQKFEVIVIIWLASATVGYVTISSALAWHLSRNKTRFAPTDDIINRIIRLTVQTGLVTAVCAVIDLVCYLTILYTNCLISCLNCRGGRKFSMSTENSVGKVNGSNRGISVHVESHEMIDVDAEQRHIFGQSTCQKEEWNESSVGVAPSAFAF
ncbi:hypothetical protein F5I97DRAFT_1830472 [Phlebopus sp. FC_14]|nr:hypothetical protein F5I97DRAFT_1830472 [Phlebopus sp. FC_14]